jgi:hypothetical protein
VVPGDAGHGLIASIQIERGVVEPLSQRWREWQRAEENRNQHPVGHLLVGHLLILGMNA